MKNKFIIQEFYTQITELNTQKMSLLSDLNNGNIKISFYHQQAVKIKNDINYLKLQIDKTKQKDSSLLNSMIDDCIYMKEYEEQNSSISPYLERETKKEDFFNLSSSYNSYADTWSKVGKINTEFSQPKFKSINKPNFSDLKFENIKLDDNFSNKETTFYFK